jgi:hypothetical protein
MEEEDRIDLQNEQLEINERKACDKILRGTICSTRANGSVCSKKIIIRLFVILREKNIIPMPDDFHSLFIDRIKMLDGTVSSPAKQTNVNLPK